MFFEDKFCQYLLQLHVRSWQFVSNKNISFYNLVSYEISFPNGRDQLPIFRAPEKHRVSFPTSIQTKKIKSGTWTMTKATTVSTKMISSPFRWTWRVRRAKRIRRLHVKVTLGQTESNYRRNLPASAQKNCKKISTVCGSWNRKKTLTWTPPFRWKILSYFNRINEFSELLQLVSQRQNIYF